MREFEPVSAVYTPPVAATIALDAVKNMKANSMRGAYLDIPDIKAYFAPVLPGQVCAIIGQTSNYKSGFLHFWERKLAEQLCHEDRQDEVIIHVSVEECVEEQMFLYLARETGETSNDLARGHFQDWDKLERAAAKVAGIPIFRIGDSLAKAEDMPNLYLSNMVRSIEALVKGEVCDPVKPAAIFFDYLQAFPFDPEHKQAVGTEQRRLQVREDMYRLRMAASYFKCPVIVAVQAKQHLDNIKGDVMIPGMYDGEESSSIAQRCDRIITLWMPKTTSLINSIIEVGGKNVKVDENLFYIKVCKQRGGLPAGQVFKCRIDFLRNEISTEARPQ
jgi:hypothetical protein